MAYGDFQHLCDFKLARLEVVRIGDRRHKSVDKEMRYCRHIVQITKVLDIVRKNAHLLMSLANGGRQQRPVFGVHAASREGDFAFVILDKLRTLVK